MVVAAREMRASGLCRQQHQFGMTKCVSARLHPASKPQVLFVASTVTSDLDEVIRSRAAISAGRNSLSTIQIRPCFQNP